MNSDVVTDASATEDARLVELSLDGNRDAFGLLVARYQSPVCALAYSACGNISQSEDLAQETFIVAWRKLCDLKEPARFKSWLYGIARNLVNNAFRRQSRNPLATAEPLDEGIVAATSDSNPTGQAISKEEEEILWRSLKHLPEDYREPLVLFYREHQSIELVAAILDLSEETVRQRLSRGRRLLHERVIAFVEGALEQTAPGRTFALGVMAALPGVTLAATSSAVGSTALKGTAAGKAAATAAPFATLLGPLIGFFGAVAGTWAMAIELPESSRERKFACKAWAFCWALTILFVLGVYLGTHTADWNAHPRILTAVLLGSAFGYCAALCALWRWAGPVQRRIRKEEAAQALNPRSFSLSQPYEYRSPRTLLGQPLLHIRFNCVEAGKTLPAKGWIAVGTKAYGILFAHGAFAVGTISFGGFAVGLVAIGGLGLGLLAFGGLGLGLAATGGTAVGYVAYGGGAIGWLGAAGGVVLARHFALGGGALALHANDAAARAFMQGSTFFHYAEAFVWTMIGISWVPTMISVYVKRRLTRERRAVGTT
jgi:RNA polymerase sigma factor (sigma-70 family)